MVVAAVVNDVGTIGAIVSIVIDKGSDADRYLGANKYKREDIEIKIVACPLNEKHSSGYMTLLQSSEEISSEMPSMNDSTKDPADFHASDMRYIAEKAVSNVTEGSCFLILLLMVIHYQLWEF